jgi:S1-C subfamily serine protease
MDNPEPAPTPRPRPKPAVLVWSRVALAVTGLLAVFTLALFAIPELTVRWFNLDGQAQADAAFLKRQAELKAEAEAADARLTELDRRVHFVSLGFREVSRKVAPVVVNITNEKEAKENAGRGLFFDLEAKRAYLPQAEGSGILMKGNRLLTNHHVVDKAQRLRVTFASGKWVTAGADAVSSDPLTDLAVVRLPEESGAGPLRDYQATAELADSDKDVQVGDWVLAVGSPFGLKQTVTAGIISAKGRVELGILDQVELLQTDAAINPGNSGGPLFDQSGRVAGINVAIASRTGTNQGVGFAIPSNTARDIFEQLSAKGEVVRGFMGIAMQDVPPDVESRLGIADTGGVLVSHVGTGFPADDAGIRVRDIITRYNKEAVGPANALNQLRQRIARTEPGTTVPVEVLRGHRRLNLEVTVAKRPANP